MQWHCNAVWGFFCPERDPERIVAGEEIHDVVFPRAVVACRKEIGSSLTWLWNSDDEAQRSDFGGGAWSS